MSRSHFLKNTFFFSAATFISRILGYLRDAAVAYIFGANPLTDAFFVAWRIPNTLRQLVAEGSFNAAFIPIFSELTKNSPDNAKRYLSSLFSIYTLILSVITVFAVVFSDFIVGIIAPGLSEKGTLEEASTLLKIVFPYLILVGWVSFFMAVLNTKDRFFIPAVSPAVLNLSFIFFAFMLSPYYGIYSLAFGAVVGGVLQVLIQIPLLIKERIQINLSFSLLPEIKETFKRLIPAFASFGVSQFAFIVDTVIASFLVGGAISYLYYANRIFQLPIGIFAIGVGNALLVSLSKHRSENNTTAFINDLNTGLRFAVFISVPATLGMIILGKEIITALLQRGSFSSSDTEMTYLALIGYSIGLTGYALTRPLKSAFFSVGDTKTPLYSTIFGLLVSIILALIFGFLLDWGVFGLALASSAGGISGFFYLYFFSNFKVDLPELLKTLLKTLFSSMVMVVFILILKETTESIYLQVFAGVVLGASVYFLTSYLVKEKSVLFFADAVRKKLIHR